MSTHFSSWLNQPPDPRPEPRAPWLRMDSVRPNRQLIAGRLLRLERLDARSLRSSLAPLRKDSRAIQSLGVYNVNPGLINPGWLIIVVPLNYSGWLLKWYPP